jgi:hypothetical protein
LKGGGAPLISPVSQKCQGLNVVSKGSASLRSSHHKARQSRLYYQRWSLALAIRLTSDELLTTAAADHPWQAFLPWCLGATTRLGNVDASISWQKALTILLYGPEQAVHPKTRGQLRSHVRLHGKPITQRHTCKDDSNRLYPQSWEFESRAMAPKFQSGDNLAADFYRYPNTPVNR